MCKRPALLRRRFIWCRRQWCWELGVKEEQRGRSSRNWWKKCWRSTVFFKESICKIASIDLKKDETGILELAESYQVPFLTYPAEELKKAVCEDGFAESAFVESVTGVGNICERSALLAAGVQKLLIPKTARNGVTVAAAVMDLTICMED